jgi:hypothetical protein
MRCLSGLVLVAGFAALGSARAADPVAVKLEKLSAAVPDSWKKEKPANNLRKYQFKLPGAKDHPDAELTIMGESLPGAEKNFPKWKNTFVPPEGKTIDEAAKTAKWDVKGAKVDVLDVRGTWKYKERPFDPKSKEMRLEDWRVIWVIVDERNASGEGETHHFRLSGPEQTVNERAAEFEKWVKGLR